jgi:CRP-like cAMP-binding protein
MSTNKPPDFAALLRLNPLFAGLDGEAIARIAALCTRRQLAAGEVLFVKGDEGDALYGIRRGQIRIATGTEAGKRLTLNVLGPGDLLGEIALLDGRSRTADAIAAEPTELFTVRRQDFLRLLEREPRIAVHLIELLCERFRWINERMEETALQPLEVRLARRIRALAADFGTDLHISQEELGILLGVTRESVNRQLQQWRRKGIIELGRGRIRLLEPERLEKAGSA